MKQKLMKASLSTFFKVWNWASNCKVHFLFPNSRHSIRDVNVSLFFKMNEWSTLILYPPNTIRFVFQMKKIVKQKNSLSFLNIIEIKIVQYFCFCFYSFLPKVPNWNLSFQNLIRLKYKLYLLCFLFGLRK